jgi:hypothetical protein
MSAAPAAIGASGRAIAASASDIDLIAASASEIDLKIATLSVNPTASSFARTPPAISRAHPKIGKPIPARSNIAPIESISTPRPIPRCESAWSAIPPTPPQALLSLPYLDEIRFHYPVDPSASPASVDRILRTAEDIEAEQEWQLEHAPSDANREYA